MTRQPMGVGDLVEVCCDNFGGDPADRSAHLPRGTKLRITQVNRFCCEADAANPPNECCKNYALRFDQENIRWKPADRSSELADAVTALERGEPVRTAPLSLETKLALLDWFARQPAGRRWHSNYRTNGYIKFDTEFARAMLCEDSKHHCWNLPDWHCATNPKPSSPQVAKQPKPKSKPEPESKPESEPKTRKEGNSMNRAAPIKLETKTYADDANIRTLSVQKIADEIKAHLEDIDELKKLNAVPVAKITAEISRREAALKAFIAAVNALPAEE